MRFIDLAKHNVIRLVVLLMYAHFNFATVTPAFAQARGSQVRHSVACPDCRIEITRVTEFGSVSDPVLLSPSLYNLDLDSQGRFIAATYDRHQIAVYGANGKYVTSFGRSGQGPGEFSGSIRRVEVGQADTIYVFHGQFISVFSPKFTFVRTVRLPPRNIGEVMALVADGRFLLAGAIRTPTEIGQPYHILAPSGVVVEKSFGYNGQPVGPGRPTPDNGVLHPTPDRKSLWGLAHGSGYGLVRWSVAGTLLDSVELIDVPWLKEPIPRLPVRTIVGFDGKRDTMPRPGFVIDLAGVDSSGLVWIVIGKPVAYDSVANNYRFSTRIEAFDPRNRAIVASKLIETPIKLLDGSNFAVSSVRDNSGVVRYTIWRIQIRR